MVLKKVLIVVPVTLIIICILAIKPILAQLSSPIPSEVYDIARANTVLIGRDLSKGQVEGVEEAEDAGSGVIIARQSDAKPSLAKDDPKTRLIYRYWLLTNAHVVGLEDTRYGIRTADGEVYPEGDAPDPKNQDEAYNHSPQIYRFGESCSNSNQNSTNSEDCFRGTDLAVLTFYSDKEYPVATLGNSSTVKEGNTVLVSGWPEPEANGKRVRFSSPGSIKNVLPLGKLAGNYTLVTTLRGKQGISGGPVFNRAGELVAIYGKGQKRGDEIGSGDNYAIDIGQFIALQSTKAIGEEKEYATAFTSPPPRLTGATPRDPQAISFGRKYENTGDNMTKEERSNLYLADLLRDDPRRKAISELDQKYGCWTNYGDGTSGGGLLETRGQFTQDINRCLGSLERLIAASTADKVSQEDMNALKEKVEALSARVAKLKMGGSVSATTPVGESIPASIVKFNFRSPGPYSYCLEDIIQLHLSVAGFKQRGRRADCLPEVFATYADKGLTRAQARQLVEAANAYATTAFTGVKLYPPAGQRIRIAELFGFVYEIDAKR